MRFLVLFILLPLASADVIGDLMALQSEASQTATTINASLNGTMSMNTSGLADAMTASIRVAQTNLTAYNVPHLGSPTLTIASPYSRTDDEAPQISENMTTAIESAYLDYIDNMDDLAAAFQRRGKLYHSEMNAPVYASLQALATIVSRYGRNFTSNRWISQPATIRTFTAGSSIVNAQAAWANNVNYPGKFKREARRSA